MNLERSVKKMKYSILDRINNLPQSRHKLTKNKLPIALGISKATFKMWLYIGLDDHRQIPLNKLQAIAHFLNVKVDALLNEAPDIITFEDLQKLKAEDHRKNFKIKSKKK